MSTCAVKTHPMYASLENTLGEVGAHYVWNKRKGDIDLTDTELYKEASEAYSEQGAAVITALAESPVIKAAFGKDIPPLEYMEHAVYKNTEWYKKLQNADKIIVRKRLAGKYAEEAKIAGIKTARSIGKFVVLKKDTLEAFKKYGQAAMFSKYGFKVSENLTVKKDRKTNITTGHLKTQYGTLEFKMHLFETQEDAVKGMSIGGRPKTKTPKNTLNARINEPSIVRFAVNKNVKELLDNLNNLMGSQHTTLDAAVQEVSNMVATAQQTINSLSPNANVELTQRIYSLLTNLTKEEVLDGIRDMMVTETNNSAEDTERLIALLDVLPRELLILVDSKAHINGGAFARPYIASTVNEFRYKGAEILPEDWVFRMHPMLLNFNNAINVPDYGNQRVLFSLVAKDLNKRYNLGIDINNLPTTQGEGVLTDALSTALGITFNTANSIVNNTKLKVRHSLVTKISDKILDGNNELALQKIAIQTLLRGIVKLKEIVKKSASPVTAVHYEKDKISTLNKGLKVDVISVAAHEWGHVLDHYLAHTSPELNKALYTFIIDLYQNNLLGDYILEGLTARSYPIDKLHEITPDLLGGLMMVKAFGTDTVLNEIDTDNVISAFLKIILKDTPKLHELIDKNFKDFLPQPKVVVENAAPVQKTALEKLMDIMKAIMRKIYAPFSRLHKNNINTNTEGTIKEGQEVVTALHKMLLVFDKAVDPTHFALPALVNVGRFKDLFGKTVKDFKPSIDRLQDLFQYSTDEETLLKQNMYILAEKLGIKIEIAENIVGVTNILTGVTHNVAATAHLLDKTIRLTRGVATPLHLPEELAHFFVKLLGRDNPLYIKMMTDIVNYSKFTTVQKKYDGVYMSNITVKEEAIGQVLASRLMESANQMIADILTPVQQKQVDSWWKHLWNIIKKIFSKISTDKATAKAAENFTDAFDKVAHLMMQGDTSELQHTEVRPEDIEGPNVVMYSLADTAPTEAQLEAEKKILAVHNRMTLEESSHTYSIKIGDVWKKISKSVTSLVEDLKKTRHWTSKRDSEEDKAFDELARTVGSMGHKVMDNIAKRLIEKRLHGEYITPAEMHGLAPGIYKMLEGYVMDLMNSFPGGTRFLSEVRVYNPKKDMAGTIDFIAITADGTAHVYDWKFTSFSQKDGKVKAERVAWYKEEEYNVQISEYAAILQGEQYGIEKIGHVRAIPVRTVYSSLHPTTKTKVPMYLKALQIGKAVVSAPTATPHLEPIAAVTERTGDDQIDSLIDVLIRRREKVRKAKVTGKDETELLVAKSERQTILSKLTRAISDLQLRKSVATLLDNALYELEVFKEKDFNNMSEDELREVEEYVKFYGGLQRNHLINIVKTSTDTELVGKISNVVRNADILYNDIKAAVRKRLSETGKAQGVSDIFRTVKESSLMSRMFNTFSQQDNPVIKTFARLLFGTKEQARREYEPVAVRIETAVANLVEWGKRNGAAGRDIYNHIVRRAPDGTLTLVPGWDAEFYKNAKEAAETKNVAWLEKNMVFDEKAFNEYKNRKIKMLKIHLGKDAKRLAATISDIDKYMNPLKSKKAYLYYESNYFLKPVEKHRSKEYKFIHQKGNEALKDFYELYQSLTKEYQDILGIDRKKNFVWFVEDDLIDSVLGGGIGFTQGIESILSAMEHKTSRFGAIHSVNPMTGQKEMSIPVLFATPNFITDAEGNVTVDNKRQTNDLGRSLSMVASMAIHHKHMAEIEGTVLLLRQLLEPENHKEVITDTSGRPAKDVARNKLLEAMGSAATLEQFNDYMNYYIYGVREKFKENTFKLFGRDVGAIRAINAVTKYFVGKTLAGNPVSIVANFTVGEMTSFIIAAGGRYYDKAQWTNSVAYLLPSRDAVAMAAIGAFDLTDNHIGFKRALQASVSWATRNLTFDNLMIGQRKGDEVVRNGILLAMMQSHGLKDGKIVKIKDGDTATKSLLTLSSIKDDKFHIEGITNVDGMIDELQKFRWKVQEVGTKSLGNNSYDDIRLLNLTVLGRALLVFRSWIPRTIQERFGDLHFNDRLDAVEMGRFRTTYQMVFEKNIPTTIANLSNVLLNVVSLGTFGKIDKSANFEERVEEIYKELLASDPTIDADEITLEVFTEMYKANFKAMMVELQILTFMAMFLLTGIAGDPDDPEDKKISLAKYLARQMERNFNELAFYYTKRSFDDIIRAPIPLLTLLDQIGKVSTVIFKEAEAALDSSIQLNEGRRFTRYFNRLLIGGNAFESFLYYLDPDYGKAAYRTKRDK
jgi:hypothetical protein